MLLVLPPLPAISVNYGKVKGQKFHFRSFFEKVQLKQIETCMSK